MKIQATPKLNKLYDHHALIKKVRAGLNDIKPLVEKDHESTVRYFKKKPTFKARLTYKAGDFILTCVPSGNKEAVKIWLILNNGARRRKAVMSADYRPGTIPNTIRTRSSKGRVLFVSRMVKGKKIEARNWTTVISKRNTPLVQAAMRKAMRDATKTKK